MNGAGCFSFAEEIGNSIMRSVWNGKNRLWALLCLVGIALVFLPGCDDAPKRPGEGFFWYPGFRDWWRIPLVFPWQINIADTFDRGSLEKYDFSSSIAEAENTSFLHDITAFCDAENYWFFKDEKHKFHAFHIRSEKLRRFDAEEEFRLFLEREKLPFSGWKDLKTLCDERWKVADTVDRDPARGFYVQKKISYGLRVPFKMPWQMILTDSGAYIGKYDPEQSFSKRRQPREWEKMTGNVTAVAWGEPFIAFRQESREQPYGCLVCAIEKIFYFPTREKLYEFLLFSGFPIPPLGLIGPREFYELRWRTVDKIRRTDPKALPVD